MTKSHEVRLSVLEDQMGRIVSDIESEKATRARTNDTVMGMLKGIDLCQRKTEKLVWCGLGGLAVLQFVIPLLFHR